MIADLYLHGTDIEVEFDHYPADPETGTPEEYDIVKVSFDGNEVRVDEWTKEIVIDGLKEEERRQQRERLRSHRNYPRIY